MALLLPAQPPGSARARAFEVIFGHETRWGRTFDGVVIVLILASVLVVMLDSVAEVRLAYREELRVLEWIFTILFTIEYGLRIWSLRNPGSYVRSFFGVIDLLSVLPTYLSVILPGGQFFAVIRVLRVIRVFRVFKLVRFVGEASVLSTALRNARYKIVVFLVAVLCIVIVVGSMMYIVEGAQGGFTSIPKGMYWAVVTLTTVGYGDIAPTTPFGQAVAAFVMILGYGVIAVPTGIVTAEIAMLPRSPEGATIACPRCEHIEIDTDARYCRVCGAQLRDPYAGMHQ